MNGQSVLTDPGKIAQAAERIYEEKYKADYEKSFWGEFVVINVYDGAAYRGEFAEEALQKAREEAPYGVFHLIRIGAPGAFKVSYIGQRQASWNWTLRSAG